MIDKAVCSLLIPFTFKEDDWEKIDECKEPPSKTIIEDIKKSGCYDSKEWFSYCLKNMPVNETFQMVGSPLLNSKGGILVKRMEFSQPARAFLGLNRNENRIYSLKKDPINFNLGKIRLLFFKNGIGMIHLGISSDNISPDALLNFNEQIAAIQKDIKFTYENQVSKEESITIVGSIKQLISKILSVQTYIQIGPYKKETFGRAYILEYLIGYIDQDYRPQYFEMLRNQRRSNMRAVASIDSCCFFNPFEYITWIVGEKTLACYSDMRVCGEDNHSFLTGPGGLIKSIDLNYSTLYAYLIMIHLLLRDAEISRGTEIINQLLTLPVNKLSAEAHINELFDIYVSTNIWKLNDRIADVFSMNQSSIDEKIASISIQMDKISENFSARLSGLTDKTDYLVKQIDYLISFTDTELKTFLDEQRKMLRESGPVDQEEKVDKFISHSASYIDEKVGLSGDEIVKRERDGLEMLFGERWQYLLPSSQTSLVSAGALLKRCSDINTHNFDFSGICICATAALEAELKRVFFDGLLDFMVDRYGNPGIDDPSEIYKNWPDVLLTVPKYQYIGGTNSKIRKVNHFTLGNLPFLFGETGKLSEAPFIRANQLKQAEMMKTRMSEYLATIVFDYYKDMPYEAFYRESKREDCFTCQPGCFVWKCEQIRENYRNKAAHVNVMSQEEASSCYQSIITKPDTYIYNAEIAGTILELYSKINGIKLTKVCHGKAVSEKVMSNTTNRFSIGQVVELENLEVTTKGVLRGTIVGSSVGASLSKKHLMDIGILPRQYLGKRIFVKLVRWDENGQKYNAEWNK